jgi:protein-tyrosine phosphatase
MLTRRNVLAGGLALAPFAQALAKAPALADATCTRLSGDQVKIDWGGEGPVQVRMATAPDGPYRLVLAQAAKGGWRGRAPVTPRPYFRLTGAGGAAETAERVLPLAGGRNFRDLGGYRAADGRMVHWGQLYRSGAMTGLTEGDYAYLSKLGIAVICDFRSTGEREREPNRWPGPAAPRMIARDYRMDLSGLQPGAGLAPGAEQMRARMIKVYEAMPYDQAESYTKMFAELAAGHTPLAFNCSAGKDRTGVAAALILTTLGVPRTTVLADYALTDKVVDLEAVLHGADGAPAGFPGVAASSIEVRKAILSADPAYLAAALDAMTRREGSVDAFVRRRLGVTPAQKATIQARLLKRV